MLQIHPGRATSTRRSPRLLVVEGNIEARRRLSTLLQDHDAKVALAKTAAEAIEMMDDAQFLEFDFDGLIVNDRLPDASGWRVIREFKRQYPTVPVVLLSDTEDLALSLWTRARSIPVVASAALPSLTMWVDRVRASVA